MKTKSIPQPATALPWRTGQHDEGYSAPIFATGEVIPERVGNPKERPFIVLQALYCDTQGRPEARQNAEYIVTAANAFQDLVEALQKAWLVFEDLRTSSPGWLGKTCMQDIGRFNQFLCQAPSALAKAGVHVDPATGGLRGEI